MTQDGNIITAAAGKVFRRIADGFVYGSEIALGMTYYIGGVKLDTPHQDTADDFEEIDAPEDTTEITAEEALQIITGEDE